MGCHIISLSVRALKYTYRWAAAGHRDRGLIMDVTVHNDVQGVKKRTTPTKKNLTNRRSPASPRPPSNVGQGEYEVGAKVGSPTLEWGKGGDHRLFVKFFFVGVVGNDDGDGDDDDDEDPDDEMMRMTVMTQMMTTMEMMTTTVMMTTMSAIHCKKWLIRLIRPLIRCKKWLIR